MPTKTNTLKSHSRNGTRLTDLVEFLHLSAKELNRKKKQRKIIFSAITALMFIAVFAFILSESNHQKSLNLQEEITRTAKANSIATKAYTTLEHDPTLAFRLAEASYNIEPTPLNKQVIMASYAQVPFYAKLEGHTSWVVYAEYSLDGNFIVTAGNDNDARLWDKNGKLISVLKGHTAPLPYGTKSAIFSHDGKNILTCSKDSTARLWNIQGECLAVMKHNGAVNSVCFSPDGEKVLTASSDKTARVWDLKGYEIVKMEHEKGVRKAVFSPDGKFISLIYDNKVRIYKSFGILIKEMSNHTQRCYDLAFANKSEYFATTSFDSTIRVWSINGQPLSVLTGHFAVPKTILFNSTDSLMLSSSDDDKAILWNIKGKKIKEFFKHSANLWSAQFSPSGNLIATASDDGTARLWDLEGNELMVLKGHTSQVFSAQFSPDGKQLVTASGDGTARIWTIEPTENPIFKGHTAYIVDAVFSPDYQKILTSSYDATARLWNKGGIFLKILGGFESNYINSANFSPNNQNIIVAASDGQLRFFDISGKLMNVYKMENGGYMSTKYSDDGKLLLIKLPSENSAMIWNESKDTIQQFNKISTINFIGKSQSVWSISIDSTLYFWQQQNQTDSLHYKKFLQLKIPNTSFTAAEFSPSPFGEGRGGVSNRGGVSKWLITASEDSILRVWNMQFLLGSLNSNGELTVFGKDKALQEMKVNAILSSIVFSPTEEKFVSVSNDNIIRLWNLDGHVIAEMKGHSDGIQDVNFSHDGKNIVSGSLDKTVKLWDLTGSELMTYTGYGNNINKAKFSPDNKYILSASDDMTARLMPVSVEMVLEKINKEKVRGEVWRLGEKEMGVYGVK